MEPAPPAWAPGSALATLSALTAAAFSALVWAALSVLALEAAAWTAALVVAPALAAAGEGRFQGG
jgi:hypothetical protein